MFSRDLTLKMPSTDQDILHDISDEDLHKLKELYSKHLPYANKVYGLLDVTLRWKKKAGYDKVKFFSVNGDWSDGTFFALMEHSCYDVFFFTLDETCEKIGKAMKETKKIDFDHRDIYVYSIYQKYYDKIVQGVKDAGIEIVQVDWTQAFYLPWDVLNNYKVECPEGYYISKLLPEHARLVNEPWVRKYDGSEEYLTTFIELNDCHGIFTKDDNELVSWILMNSVGSIGMMETVEAHRRKGLASVLIASLCKTIAQEGRQPFTNILSHNEPSKRMFAKMGFVFFTDSYSLYLKKRIA